MHQAVKLGQEGDAADSADGVNPQEEVPRVSFFFSNYNHQEQSFFFLYSYWKLFVLFQLKGKANANWLNICKWINVSDTSENQTKRYMWLVLFFCHKTSDEKRANVSKQSRMVFNCFLTHVEN